MLSNVLVDRTKKSGFSLKLTHRDTGITVCEKDLPKVFADRKKNTAALFALLENKVNAETKGHKG